MMISVIGTNLLYWPVLKPQFHTTGIVLTTRPIHKHYVIKLHQLSSNLTAKLKCLQQARKWSVHVNVLGTSTFIRSEALF